MPTIDLNAKRAARREARGHEEPNEIVVDGEHYPLPDEVPLELLEALDLDAMSGTVELSEKEAEGLSPEEAAAALEVKRNHAVTEQKEALIGLLRAFIGAETFDTLKARHGLSLNDVMDIITELAPMMERSFGVPLEMPSASSDS